MFRLTLFLSLLVSFFFPLNYPLSKDQFVILFDQTMLGKHIHTHTHFLSLSLCISISVYLALFLSFFLYLCLSRYISLCFRLSVYLYDSVSLSFFLSTSICILFLICVISNFSCYCVTLLLSFSISVLSLLLFWFLFEDLFSFLSEGIAYQNRFSFYVIGSCFDFPFHVEAIKIVPHPRLKTDFLPIKSSLFCKWITG